MNLHPIFEHIFDVYGMRREPSPYIMAQRVRTLFDDAGWQVLPVILPDKFASYAVVVAGPDGHAYRLTVTLEDGK